MDRSPCREQRAVLAAVLALGVLSAFPAFPGEGNPAALSAEPADRRSADLEPEPSDAVVAEIRIRPENIFDLEDPRENNWLFRLANRLHIRTRPYVIADQLLFRSGERYDPRLLAESERILRSNVYLYDARVRPAAVRDGRVDVEVITRDVWTLQPGFSFQRKGGKNATSIDVQELNLLGTGATLRFARSSTADRDTESVQFVKERLFGTWLRTDLLFANNSDGRTQRYLAERPFYSLDTRWSAGCVFSEDDRIASLIGDGPIASRFRERTRTFQLSGGWSRGLVRGRVRRVLLGAVREETRFDEAPDGTGGAMLPAGHRLAYPFVGIEGIEDEYVKTENFDQIGRTEDVFLGMRVRATVGYATPRFGSDRTAFPFSVSAGKGLRYGERWTVLLDGAVDGRVEDDSARDSTISAEIRSYLRLSRSWLFFASVTGSRVIDPDGEHQLLLGGDNGLRGYPLRYQAGDREFLSTLEQRYYSSWYPFRLFRVGGAIFFDAGRAWGGDRTGLPDPGPLRDAGVGLRIGHTRSGLGNVIHVDVAFPFDGDPSIARAQLLVETKQSF